MGVDLNTILAIIGAMGGIEGIKWGIRAWANRKTNARIADAQADVEEFKALREYNEFLQKQLSEKEERFVEQTGRLRQGAGRAFHLKRELLGREDRTGLKRCEKRNVAIVSRRTVIN